MATLPQGRGIRSGSDSYVDQGEAYRVRTLFNVVGVPPKGCLPANLTQTEVDHFFVQSGETAGRGKGPYKRWAICNGNNGTPDLRSLFVRGAADATGAGATGGRDSSAHTHGADDGSNHGTLRAKINLNNADDTIVADIDGTSAAWDADRQQPTAGAIVDPGVYAQTQAVNVMGETAAASVTDNRPAFYAMPWLMRLN